MEIPYFEYDHCRCGHSVDDHQMWSNENGSYHCLSIGCNCMSAGVMNTPKLPNQNPAPTPNDTQPVVDQLLKYLLDRKQLGVQRYGTPLQADNGRDSLRDAFEEAVDLATYLAQTLIERDGHL